MTTLVLAGVICGLILLPHVTRLERAAPATAATLWAVALGLRALAGISAATYLVLVLPATADFNELTRWCWHAIVPLAATHLMLNGHGIGDAASMIPGLLLAASAISLVFGIVRAVRAVRRMLTRDAIGPGPRDSVIVHGQRIFVAAAGLGHPQLVVSVGALAAFDDEELAASLDHEHGHIHRRHRFVLLYSELCRALGRFIPGTESAVRQLAFHLERDADAWALARCNDPFALASAICKAALSPQWPTTPALTALSGTGTVTARVDELLDGESRIGGLRAALLNAAALLGVVLLLGLTVMVPATFAASGGESTSTPPQSLRDCGS